MTRRILMTADPVGGVWTYALELARALAPNEVLLAAMGAPVQPHQRREAAALANLELVESAFRLEWMDEPWDDLARAGDWLLDLAGRFRPDVVHLNGYVHAALPWPAPVLVVAHSCVLSWWQAVKGEPAPPRWDRYREEIQRGLAAAGMVIAPSRAMLADLRAHSGPLLRRTRVIPNGRSAELFPPRAKKNLVLAAGRGWDEAKNLGALARVAPALPWPVCLAGDGAGAGFSGVELLGRLAPAELARWYGEAAIYCLPARYEPFGLSVLEAALAGCALVLGDIPSLRENWHDAAVFVPPNDEEALAGALAALIGDAHRRAGLRARARARAQRFTPPRMTAAYLDAYETVIAAQGEAICA